MKKKYNYLLLKIYYSFKVLTRIQRIIGIFILIDVNKVDNFVTNPFALNILDISFDKKTTEFEKNFVF